MASKKSKPKLEWRLVVGHPNIKSTVWTHLDYRIYFARFNGLFGHEVYDNREDARFAAKLKTRDNDAYHYHAKQFDPSKDKLLPP